MQEFNQEEINNKDIEIQRHLVKMEEQERQQRQMEERYHELEKTNRVKLLEIIYKYTNNFCRDFTRILNKS